MSRATLQTGARAGAVTLLNGYKAANGLTAQVYRARPIQLKVPSFFIERMDENDDDFSPDETQRTVRVAIRCVWGVYDAGSTVDQRDAFVDGFYAYVMDNGAHAFGPNTLLDWVSVDDQEDYVAGWAKPPDANEYFASLVTLEGFAST